jgi:1-acyl-sn-glycerol-3-phosphate acyltransferase
MKEFDYSTLHIDPFYRRFTAPASRVLPLLYKPLVVSGIENIPVGGPLIIACNHVNARDPAIIIASSFRKQEVHFISKEELFENPAVALYFKLMGAFPIRRGVGARKALDYSRRLLEAGRCVGIFPDGKRNPGLPPQPGYTGAAWLVEKTGAPVLPAAIYSPLRGSFGEPTYLRYGSVMRLDLGEGKHKGRREATEQLMAEITRIWNGLREEYGPREENS